MWLNLRSVEERLNTAFVGRRIVYFTSAPSTQDAARREAEGGAPEGTVVLAEEQTAGRGRLGRSWASPAGTNLYLTLILRPPLQYLRLPIVITPLAVVRAIEESSGLSTQIKWPNDVLIGGRKVSGVLIESEVRGSDVRYILVGPGINVNLEVDQVPEIADIATSLKRELGREVPREEVLAAFLNHFEALYLRARRGEPMHQEWRSRLETLGRQVRVTFGEQVEEGLAEDVDAEGSLILRHPDGSTVTIAAGEVTLREG